MKQYQLSTDTGFLAFLFVYHVSFSFLFTWYLGQYGGDAIAYWGLRTEVVEQPERWFSHWGTRSYFIQWLNYIPSYILGLPMWLGNAGYSILSFFGYFLLYRQVREHIDIKSNPWLQYSLWLVFLMPNLHFWTSAIGKESLSFLGLVLFLRGLHLVRPGWGYLLTGIAFSYMVRPMQGLILLSGLMLLIACSRPLSVEIKAGMLLITGVVAFFMMRFILYITHIPFLHPAKILEFSASQFEFLEGYGASSAVPMAEYSWPVKIWTLFFRPFWGEWESIWYAAAVLENSMSLFLILCAIVLLRRSGWKKVPLFIYAGIGFGLLLTGVYALTLNNLGIIMRLKSFYMIFFQLLFVYALAFAFSKKEPASNP